jgi:hypothetical protein
VLQTLQKWDLIRLVYILGKGTVVIITGKEYGIIPGADFYQALLMAWLGDSPISRSLKKELLGSD